jgi:hypothetical protein
MLFISPIDYNETLIDISEFKTPTFIIAFQSNDSTLGFSKDDLSFEFQKALLQKSLFWDIKKEHLEILEDSKIEFYRYDMSGIVFLSPKTEFIKNEIEIISKYKQQQKKYKLLLKKGINSILPTKPPIINVYSSDLKKYDAKQIENYQQNNEGVLIWNWGYFQGYFICIDNNKNSLKNRILELCKKLNIDFLEVNTFKEIPEF